MACLENVVHYRENQLKSAPVKLGIHRKISLLPALWMLSPYLLTPASECGLSNVISTSAGQVEDAEFFKKSESATGEQGQPAMFLKALLMSLEVLKFETIAKYSTYLYLLFI